MDEENDLLTVLVGEVLGLRVATQLLAAHLAYATRGGNEELKLLHGLAISHLDAVEVVFSGFNELAIRANAERCLDTIFARANVKP
jgi:hypothetical protein